MQQLQQEWCFTSHRRDHLSRSLCDSWRPSRSEWPVGGFQRQRQCWWVFLHPGQRGLPDDMQGLQLHTMTMALSDADAIVSRVRRCSESTRLWLLHFWTFNSSTHQITNYHQLYCFSWAPCMWSHSHFDCTAHVAQVPVCPLVVIQGQTSCGERVAVSG